MEKIVIIGPSGAGKTTLAKALSRILRMKVFHMDRFFWKPNWEREDSDTRMELLEKFIMDKRWIIEGSYFRLFESCLDEADTIIFLDIHPFLCLQRIIKRHIEYRGRPRRDIPKGCVDKLDIHYLFRVLAFPWQDRKKLEQKLYGYESKQIIPLRSPKEVEDFLVQLEQNMSNNKQGSSNKAVPNPGARPLATIR
jgi:adenylate kinase family enzyme